ncbi:hypothetical protein GCM10009641_86220 [Mycobacterium cookii]
MGHGPAHQHQYGPERAFALREPPRDDARRCQVSEGHCGVGAGEVTDDVGEPVRYDEVAAGIRLDTDLRQLPE